MVYINICIKQQTCENFDAIDCWSCEIIMEKKHILVATSFNVPWIRDLTWGLELSPFKYLREFIPIFFSQKLHSGGDVSHNVICYQQLPIALNQVANKYFEYLLIVFSAYTGIRIFHRDSTCLNIIIKMLCEIYFWRFSDIRYCATNMILEKHNKLNGS